MAQIRSADPSPPSPDGQSEDSFVDPWEVDFDNVDANNIDFYSSIQENVDKYRDEFSIIAQSHWGLKATTFLLSGTGNDQVDQSWKPVRLLGKGGFGLVGLWHKRDRAGKTVDEVAIKETNRPDDNPKYSLGRDPRVAREAVIMKQLNDQERRRTPAIQNILRLKSFKNFPAARRWRFYLEYAPYGDLSMLLGSYKAWNAYLPEEFLWHLFYSLARAAVVMEAGPFTDLESQERTARTVVHFDIKPENIYMGYPNEAAVLANYPTIKVADFGLAELTGEDDHENPRDMRRRGTKGYKPPEQTLFTIRWKRRPTGFQHDTRQKRSVLEALEKNMYDPGYQYLSPHNVWTFGKVMYDMLNLCYADDLKENMAKTQEARYYGPLDQHAIPEIHTTRNPEYSSELRQLIRECLHLEIGKRPTPQQLVQRTGEGLNEAVKAWRLQSGDFNGPRLYHMGNEVNHMPLGNGRMPMRRHDFRNLRKGNFPDPKWEPLLSGRWASSVRRGDLIGRPIEEGGPKQKKQLFTMARFSVDPKDSKKIIWELIEESSEDDEAGGDVENGGDDPQDETDYQRDLGFKLRNQGPHDTEKLEPPVRTKKVTSKRPSHSRLTRKDGAAQPPPGAAAAVINPPAETARPQRLKLNPPKPPRDDVNAAGPPQGKRPEKKRARTKQPETKQPEKKRARTKQPETKQPQPKPKRRRLMGLSVDGSTGEADGHVVEGHNLRKRPRRGE